MVERLEWLTDVPTPALDGTEHQLKACARAHRKGRLKRILVRGKSSGQIALEASNGAAFDVNKWPS